MNAASIEGRGLVVLRIMRLIAFEYESPAGVGCDSEEDIEMLDNGQSGDKDERTEVIHSKS